MTYNTLNANQLKLLIRDAPGGPEARNNTERRVILRNMSQDDQAQAFLTHNIVRPAGELGEDGNVIGDGPVMDKQAELDAAREEIRVLKETAGNAVAGHRQPGFESMGGDDRLTVFSEMSTGTRQIFVASISLIGRRRGWGEVKDATLLHAMQYKLGLIDLSDFFGGEPLTSAISVQTAFSNMASYLEEMFKDKVTGMRDLLRRFNLLWGHDDVTVGQMLEFEKRIRVKMSDKVSDYRFESVEMAFMSEWNDVKWARYAPAPQFYQQPRDTLIHQSYQPSRQPPPPHDDSYSYPPPPPRYRQPAVKRQRTDRPNTCWDWNDGVACRGNPCAREHKCTGCAQPHKYVDCPGNGGKERASLCR
jgi:hypothetical protein